MHLVDLTGQRFGELIVLSRIENDPLGRARWRVRCSCGIEKEASSWHLRDGRVVSCGHVMRTVWKRNITHGKSASAEYAVWRAIISRCENPTCREYKWYGKRGIKICSEWRNDFAAYLDYLTTRLGPKPSPKH